MDSNCCGTCDAVCRVRSNLKGGSQEAVDSALTSTMKLSSSLISLQALLLLGASVTLAAPPNLFAEQVQHVLAQPSIDHLSHSLEQGWSAATGFIDEAQKGIFKTKSNLDKWFHAGREWIKQDGMLCEFYRWNMTFALLTKVVDEYVSNPAFADYSLRVAEPKLCDPSVKQHSGYLDIADDKHLFFWCVPEHLAYFCSNLARFFESRVNPDEAPVILWLNGGPGCSSSTGLLFELGPCNISDNGKNTTANPYSWNSHANIIFLDQPVNVGFSYAEDGTTVSTSPVAGKDVYAFLQLFFGRFKKYSNLPFHLAAESYGGTYAPNFASEIFKQNKELQLKSELSASRSHINLASVILANGLTDPYTQFGSVGDYVCDGPYPVYDPQSPQCAAIKSKIPTCQRLIKSCYDFNSKWACTPAILYCNGQIFGPLMRAYCITLSSRRLHDRQKPA